MVSHYAYQFEQLSSLLVANAPLWRCEPFKATPGWAAVPSPIMQVLQQLDDNTVRAAQSSDASLLKALHSCLPDQCRNIESLCDLPHFPEPVAEPARPHIPGRKWQQIVHFGSALQQCNQPLLEWCAGKAHLGRWLQRHYDCEVTALERDQTLVDQGNLLNQADSTQQNPAASVTMQQCDVLGNQTHRHLKTNPHVVALHACGGLHRKLLDDVSQNAVQRVSWSPCCYHKYLDNGYEPMSQAGKRANLNLSIPEIRTAVRQNSTAGRAEKQRHEQRQIWRLGFDQLQRALSASDHYQPVPSLPAHLDHGSFADFCRHVATLKGIPLQDTIDFAAFEEAGRQRYAEVSRQELVRELFRRPIELWLVLDEILFLEERGYHCKLGVFCATDITPRNLLIDATRHKSSPSPA